MKLKQYKLVPANGGDAVTLVTVGIADTGNMADGFMTNVNPKAVCLVDRNKHRLMNLSSAYSATSERTSIIF